MNFNDLSALEKLGMAAGLIIILLFGLFLLYTSIDDKK